ncbi:hypothetical protein TNCV_1878881 [Trichonephila clavipes]|nr:hypothetical protein TNCV_1878881 [Trichonephila clavipes]
MGTQNVVDVLSKNPVERTAGENVACTIIRDVVLLSREQLTEEQRRDPLKTQRIARLMRQYARSGLATFD